MFSILEIKFTIIVILVNFAIIEKSWFQYLGLLKQTKQLVYIIKETCIVNLVANGWKFYLYLFIAIVP